jgi:rubredoxin
VPVYVQCPHCDHPQVIAAHRRGKAVFCRQCGWVYQTSKQAGTVRPLAISTISELRERQSAGGKVYVIDA